MSTAEITEVTQITSFTQIRERWGHRCDYFIVIGFCIVLGGQLYLNFGRKPADAKPTDAKTAEVSPAPSPVRPALAKRLVGPTRPTHQIRLVRR